ncbi:hypothetical protein ALC60_05628 [Trachymyrmex zeteki]|uniref:Uncharacterized protein n=1 Tax=Mycetomoellerius zeteki TaxID=64791 RepID=A0A151X572_9HYME|nr:hypothetical protein ALC60_05628 [Trachymyrmex zeteki]
MGEQITVKYKIITKVRLARYFLEVPMLIAKINDDCILEVDFLKLFNLQNTFDSIFLNSFAEKDASLVVALNMLRRFHRV